MHYTRLKKQVYSDKGAHHSCKLGNKGAHNGITGVFNANIAKIQRNGVKNCFGRAHHDRSYKPYITVCTVGGVNIRKYAYGCAAGKRL